MPGRERHSAAQRAAIESAILEDGLNATQASQAAAAGELPNTEPFSCSPSTARGWASEARRDEPTRPDAREDGPGDDQTEDELDATERRLRRILKAEGERLESQDTPDLERVRWLARVAREVDALTRQRQRRNATGARPAPNGDVDPGDFIGTLAAAGDGNGASG
jgi:hypothetical protein